ncbi:SGS-domain-containing protein [Durotheca rogersii]|uniref:SGS-domain-containing protein n=1 Tax=Durotheca rogersii TaxID=419775 RepID=UPI00221FC4F1|nr:SGS-domain-containing protein [Durotheca rogersii]KAI5859519.1 SGS-domain-containing protein [Durotheca rogersii]
MPSPTVLADEGVKAVAAGRYEEGIEKLSEALKERPAPLWLLERSKAYLRTNDFDLALYDAEKALRVAFDRANRDLMTEAQLRRAIALFRLGRYADADICAAWVTKLVDGSRATVDDGQQNKVDENGDYTESVASITEEVKPDARDRLATAMTGNGGRSKGVSLKNQAISWRLQALTKLEQLPVGHAGRKVNISEKYPQPAAAPPARKAKKDAEPTDGDGAGDSKREEDDTSRASGSTRDAWERLWKQYRVVHAKNSVRTSFYQNDATLTIDFFAKNVPADRFALQADFENLTIGPIPAIHPDTIRVHLWGRIKPAETKQTIKSMKVELVLQKETLGKWPTLQRDSVDLLDNISVGTASQPSFPQFSAFIARTRYKAPEELDLPDFSRDQNLWYGALLDKLQAGLGEQSSPLASAGLSASPNPATEATLVAPDQERATPGKDDHVRASNPVPLSTPSSGGAGPASAPAYPTSSKKGPVNWDKFDAGGDVDEDESQNDVNKFFQKLYEGADEDTKRAMMKSYVESNGTSLSTSWAEAKDKTYKTQPPDGAEAKRWDE